MSMGVITERGDNRNRTAVAGRRADGLFLLSLFVMAVAAFLLLGSRSYVLFDDSGSYINLEKYVEGVMPVYPLFLRMNRILFGEERYLSAVAVEQALFAAVCLTVFTNLIRGQFKLRYWQAYGMFLFSLLPFTTDMPEAMTTQEIVTEGIAYAAFYLFMAVLLKAVWTKKFRYISVLFAVTFGLACTRSQLQILFGVCGVIFFYVVLMRETAGRKKIQPRVAFGLAGCACIALLGVWCTSRVSGTYQEMVGRYAYQRQQSMLAEMNVSHSEDAVGEVLVQTEADEEEAAVRSETDVEDSSLQAGVAAEKTLDSGPRQNTHAVSSQYTSLLFSRGMYEADYEDYLLFEEGHLRDLYLYLYEAADRRGCLHIYASPGLWMWRDIVGGIGAVGVECFYAEQEFYRNLPEASQAGGNVPGWNESARTIGLTLLKAHWTGFLYHTLMMLPQAFICTVFFQIAGIYLLCHLVTLFLYVSAVCLMIWAYADRKVDRACGEFMASVLGTNLVMVLVISLVFFGQQRYLVYNFGIFYMVYFLLLGQFWQIYGKNWLTKWVERRKS